MSSTNAATQVAMKDYETQFRAVFQFDEEGELKRDPVTLRAIEAWYNQSHLVIAMLACIPSEGCIRFQCDDSRKDHVLLLHAYSLSYAAFKVIQAQQKRIKKGNAREAEAEKRRAKDAERRQPEAEGDQ